MDLVTKVHYIDQNEMIGVILQIEWLLFKLIDTEDLIEWM